MSLKCNEPMMAETSGDVMIISESNKKEKNMTQLGNMVCSEKPQINEKSRNPGHQSLINMMPMILSQLGMKKLLSSGMLLPENLMRHK